MLHIEPEPTNIHRTKRMKNLEANFCEFGYVLINTKLLKKNQLRITYKSGAPIKQEPFQKIINISEEFGSYLLYIIDNNGLLDDGLQKQIPQTEQRILHALMRISKLSNKLKFKRTTLSIEDVIDRYNILRGSLEAGNTSKIVINELITLTYTLNHFNIIENSDKDWILDLLAELRP